jgi:hypothetical protein
MSGNTIYMSHITRPGITQEEREFVDVLYVAREYDELYFLALAWGIA